MKKLIFSLTLIVVFLLSCSKDELSKFKEPIIEDFFSTILDKELEIFTYLPKNYDGEKVYPIVYLLDGQYFLRSGLIKNISSLLDEEQEKGNIPELILIGIGNDQDRKFDYTFPSDSDDEASTGNGKKFYSFLKEELIKTIDLKYSVDPNKKILIGHSLGGYFTLLTLFVDEANPFSDMISSTPALSYADGALFDFDLEESNFKGTLFYTVGDEESNVVLLNNVMGKKLEEGSFSLKSTFYKGETHRSVALPSIRDGLFQIFK